MKYVVLACKTKAKLKVQSKYSIFNVIYIYVVQHLCQQFYVKIAISADVQHFIW